MSTLGTKEKINVGLEMCLFSETEIFTLWINSLQLETHVKCLGFSLEFGFFCILTTQGISVSMDYFGQHVQEN